MTEIENVHHEPPKDRSPEKAWEEYVGEVKRYYWGMTEYEVKSDIETSRKLMLEIENYGGLTAPIDRDRELSMSLYG